jgi:hypothetical protein
VAGSRIFGQSHPPKVSIKNVHHLADWHFSGRKEKGWREEIVKERNSSPFPLLPSYRVFGV